MFGTLANPYHVRPGGKIATRSQTLADGTIQVTKTKTVSRVEPCPGKPENVHLDHECYDSRIDIVVPA